MVVEHVGESVERAAAAFQVHVGVHIDRHLERTVPDDLHNDARWLAHRQEQADARAAARAAAPRARRRSGTAPRTCVSSSGVVRCAGAGGEDVVRVVPSRRRGLFGLLPPRVLGESVPDECGQRNRPTGSPGFSATGARGSSPDGAACGKPGARGQRSRRRPTRRPRASDRRMPSTISTTNRAYRRSFRADLRNALAWAAVIGLAFADRRSRHPNQACNVARDQLIAHGILEGRTKRRVCVLHGSRA